MEKTIGNETDDRLWIVVMKESGLVVWHGPPHEDTTIFDDITHEFYELHVWGKARGLRDWTYEEQFNMFRSQ